MASLGADKMLVKPMHTRLLLQQLESLFTKHHGKAATFSEDEIPAAQDGSKPKVAVRTAVKKAAVKKSAAIKKPLAV